MREGNNYQQYNDEVNIKIPLSLQGKSESC